MKRQDEASCRFFAGGNGHDGRADVQDRRESQEGGGMMMMTNGTNGVGKRAAQARLQMLERVVSEMRVQRAQGNGHDDGVGQGDTATTPTTSPPPREDIEMREENDSQRQQPGDGGHLARQGNQVRFIGATTYEAVLECIRDLQGFVEAAEGPAPALPPSQEPRDMARNSSSSGRGGGGGQNITIDHIMAQLPPKAECDGFLTFYFQQVYMIPPTLHAGQFQRAYERFWRNPDGTSLLWISILFTLLSTSLFQQTSRAAAVGGQDTATAPSDRITAFSLMAYRCLEAGDYLAGKPHSVEATLLYGMHLVLQKRDVEPVCWHILSTAVRLAQRMGYHRDASQLDRGAGVGSDRAPPLPSALSAFEAEMRRRTWYTLEYFDVVYSFQLGVPPIIQSADVDTRLPANLRDDEFDELDNDHRLQQKLDARAARHLSSSSSSSSSSLLDFTPILGFIYYSRQVQLLRRVVQQTLAVSPAPTYGDVRLLDADLRALHAEVPPSLRYRPIRESGFADSPDVIMRRLVCEIMHLKSLCVLHRRYLLRGWTANAEVSSVYGASRRTCCEAALGLLDLQAEFDEHSSEPGSRLYERRYILTNTAYHDFLLAAMCLCLDLTATTRDG